MRDLPPADWFPDPCGRYEHRYWDGYRWTSHVASRGRQALDPPVNYPTQQDGVTERQVAADRGTVWKAGHWIWRTLTPQGQAWQAYERGDDEFETTLDIDDPGHAATLREIQARGWRRINQVQHPTVRKQTSRRKSDGSGEIVWTKTRTATYYFVRSDPHEND